MNFKTFHFSRHSTGSSKFIRSSINKLRNCKWSTLTGFCAFAFSTQRNSNVDQVCLCYDLNIIITSEIDNNISKLLSNSCTTNLRMEHWTRPYHKHRRLIAIEWGLCNNRYLHCGVPRDYCTPGSMNIPNYHSYDYATNYTIDFPQTGLFSPMKSNANV